MTPAQARLKRAVRTAVEQCGGVDGAAATANRRRSVAGDWRNLNDGAFPPAECALALDEAVVAQGGLPPITAAMAREMGGLFTFLPDGVADAVTLNAMLADQCKVSGALASELIAMMADGASTPTEALAALGPAERLLSVVAHIIGELRTISEGHGGR